MAATKVASALKALLPAELPPTLSSRAGTLYSVLARYPQDGIGQRVHQTRWSMKGISDCYWEVTRTKLKLEGTHGKAWGKLVWKGVHKYSRDSCRMTSLCFHTRSCHQPTGRTYSWRSQVRLAAGCIPRSTTSVGATTNASQSMTTFQNRTTFLPIVTSLVWE